MGKMTSKKTRVCANGKVKLIKCFGSSEPNKGDNNIVEHSSDNKMSRLPATEDEPVISLKRKQEATCEDNQFAVSSGKQISTKDCCFETDNSVTMSRHLREKKPLYESELERTIRILQGKIEKYKQTKPPKNGKFPEPECSTTSSVNIVCETSSQQTSTSKETATGQSTLIQPGNSVVAAQRLPNFKQRKVLWQFTDDSDIFVKKV